MRRRIACFVFSVFVSNGSHGDKIAERYNECAADYARLGVLASQDGIYDEETAKTLGLVSFENDKKKNFFEKKEKGPAIN